MGFRRDTESMNLKQRLEVLHALDNLCSTVDSLAARNRYFIYVRGIYSHPADIGYRDGIDTHHSRVKSNLARVSTNVGRAVFYNFKEVLC